MASLGHLAVVRLLFICTLVCYQAVTSHSLPRDCSEVLADSSPNSPPADGWYKLGPRGFQQFSAICLFNTEGDEGWTVLMNNVRRDTDRWDMTWDDYKHGFGLYNDSDSFWLGNEKIHSLTSQDGRFYELRVDLVPVTGSILTAYYDLFSMMDENNNYAISFFQYNADKSTASDGLGAITNNRQFSTRDSDHDFAQFSDGSAMNCADLVDGGWWFYGDDCETYTGLMQKTPVWYGFEENIVGVIMAVRLTDAEDDSSSNSNGSD